MTEKVHKMLGLALHHATPDQESDHAFHVARTHMRDNKMAYSDINQPEPCDPKPIPAYEPKPASKKAAHAPKKAAPSRGGNLTFLYYNRDVWTFKSAEKDAISRFAKKPYAHKDDGAWWYFTSIPPGTRTKATRRAVIGEDHDVHAIYAKIIE